MKIFQITENRDGEFYKAINGLIDHLRGDEVSIIPTDTVYSFCCNINSKKGIATISKLKEVKPNKANFSIIVPSLSKLNDFVKPYSRTTYKLLNKNLPGPFTFILQANNFVPKLFDTNRKEIGIRQPNNPFILELLGQLDEAIVVSSVSTDDILKHLNDPELIVSEYKNKIGCFVDAGVLDILGSTVVDCTEEEPTIIRQGVKDLEL